jgi:PKD repeat protein
MKHTYKTLLLLVALFLTGKISYAQVSITQGFDVQNPFLPTGWQLSPGATGGGPGGANYWAGTAGAASNTNNPGVTPHGGTRVARFRSYNTAAGISQSLITAPIDYTGLGNNIAHFSFWMYRDTGAVANMDSLTVFINTDTTLGTAVRLGSVARHCTIAQPDTASPNTWNQYTFYVPNTFAGDTNYIILRGYGAAGRNIYIDDVEYDAYPALCTGQPSIGTMSASSTLLCGGSGVSLLTLTGSDYGFSGVSVQWQMSASATGPWTDTLLNATHMSTDTISMPMYYRAYINCSFSGLSDTSNVIFVDISPNPAPTITLTPTPTGAQGNQISYCAGTPGVYVSASGASTYTWSNAAGFSATGDSVMFNPTAQTTYTVIGTDASGCAASKSFVVIPRNPPNFTVTASSDTICSGNSTTLTTQGFGNYTYTWLADGTTGTTSTVSPSATTNYYVTATSNTTGCTRTDTITVYVTAAASADFTYAINDSVVSFTETLNNATIQAWFFGDGNSITASNPSHTYHGAGSYVVNMVVTTPCGIDTISKTITISTNSGIAVIDTKQVNVYPNPANNSLYMNAMPLVGEANVMIYNINGELVMSAQVNTNAQMSFDISTLSKGFYNLSMKSKNVSYRAYFVKE